MVDYNISKQRNLDVGVEKSLMRSIMKLYFLEADELISVPELEKFSYEVYEDVVTELCVTIQVEDLYSYYELKDFEDLLSIKKEYFYENYIPDIDYIQEYIVNSGFFVMSGSKTFNMPYEGVW